MSYASLAVPTGPSITLPLHEAARAARMAAAAARFVLQSAGMAALLWAVLAAPGLLSDRNSTGTRTMMAALHR